MKTRLYLDRTLKQNKRKIPQDFKPARQRDENSSIFGSHTCVTHPKEEQISCPPFHHSIMIQQSVTIQESLKSLNFITKQKMQ
jgi:hypothetical protein